MSCTLCINYYENKRERHYQDVAAFLLDKNALAERSWRSMKGRATVLPESMCMARRVFDEWLTFNISSCATENKSDLLTHAVVAAANAMYDYDNTHKSHSGSTRRKLEIMLGGLVDSLRNERLSVRAVKPTEPTEPTKQLRKRHVTFANRGELTSALQGNIDSHLLTMFSRQGGTMG